MTNILVALKSNLGCYFVNLVESANFVLAQTSLVLSNHWMRLSRIWRTLQIKEDIILRKPNWKIALLFIKNVSPFMKEFRHFALCFSSHQKIAQPGPQVFLVNCSITWSGLHFWCHFDVIGSKWQSSFQILSTAAGYGELCVWWSETGKYFEWIRR